MDIMNVSCSEIQTPAGFLYLILPVLLNHINDTDCEQSWYSEDGRLIADPSDLQTLMDPVISVSSDRLVSSLCVNLIHEIICDSAAGTHFRRVSSFRARNETAVTPNSDNLNEVTLDLQHSDHFWWLLAVFIVALLIIFLICLMKRKEIFRCFQRFISQREDDDSGNGDPEAAVRMKLRSDAPDSPNQSESERLNGSLSRG